MTLASPLARIAGLLALACSVPGVVAAPAEAVFPGAKGRLAIGGNL